MNQFDNGIYSSFLESKSKEQWKKLGAKRRAGALVPLFSVYSKKSMGIGEIPDINLIADWCNKTSMSIIQLLPMNDTGFNFTPYDCQSTFALDPVYIRLEDVEGYKESGVSKTIGKVKAKFPAGTKRVNYKVKGEKLKILWKIFKSTERLPEEYEDFVAKNHYWLNDYALYKVVKSLNDEKSWEEWEEKYKYKEDGAMEDFQQAHFDEVNFQMWLQWQLCEQFKKAKKYANLKGVLLFGDLPFLVSRDSADVWAHQNYFKLNLSSGAPPDMYFAMGQRWGMPPYNWPRIEENGFDYLKYKVKYSGNFYDMFRIDHFVGLFRLWTIKNEEPRETHGLNGVFDPANEDLWKEHGQRILRAMADATDMLPCAEDLGVVPKCSYETLDEYAVPGMDVQRWFRDWGATYDFKNSEKYRRNSIAVISSHDMSPLTLWWEDEASSVDAILVKKLCDEYGFDFEELKYKLFDMARSNPVRLRWKKEIHTADKVLAALAKGRDQAWMFYDMHRESFDEKKQFWRHVGLQGEPDKKASKQLVVSALEKISAARSIYSIQLLQDWLSLSDMFKEWEKHELRVNTPGTMSDLNWSIVMPLGLEEMLELGINSEIEKINKDNGRV